jgi:hypothetical protein
MAADLHIHVRTPELTDEILRCFFASTIGDGKWCIPFPDDDEKDLSNFWAQRDELERNCPQDDFEHGTGPYFLVANSPNIWIGEVSWLKAGLFEDGERFIPSLVEQVFVLVEEHQFITDDFIKKIKESFNLDNKTAYKLAKMEDVMAFLELHKGKEIFTVSW